MNLLLICYLLGWSATTIVFVVSARKQLIKGRESISFDETIFIPVAGLFTLVIPPFWPVFWLYVIVLTIIKY